jgi:hypothetical protein
MAAEEKGSGLRIVVAFQNYKPPFDSEKVIRSMLVVVPANYLWGLHSIVLTNVQALPRYSRERKGGGRRRAPLRESLGYYTRTWKGEPARITLLIDNLEKHWGRSWLRFGFIRDILLAEVLFHEIGHHIHRLHIPEFDGPENVAEKWSKKLSGKFLRHQYWYVMPLFYPLVWINRLGKKIAKQFRGIQAKP